MTNTSILAAFERFWQHVVSKLDEKADVEYVDNAISSAIDGAIGGSY